MSKRFTDVLIWDDDWFCELPSDYKLFWFYIKDSCDHAGVWKPKTKVFQALTGIDINPVKALELFNLEKYRIRVLTNGYWLLEDFFSFQYVKTAKHINLNNRVHKSVADIYQKTGVLLSTIKGIDQVITESGELMGVLEYESTYLRV